MEDPPAVRVRELSKHYGEVRAVDGISFDVPPREIFALLGPNGAGKSTTLRMLVTLSLPSAGSIEVFGQDVTLHASSARMQLGYLPQQLAIDGSLTGRENVWLFAGLYGIPWAQRNERVRETLRLMGLEGASQRLASTYSGGMVRRLELAQALVHNPRLLILDEPTVGLDPIARRDFWNRIGELREREGTTVVLSTHYMEEADQYADRVGLMHHGKIQALGRPQELEAQLGAGKDMEDVFRAFASDDALATGGGWKDVRATRRTAQRVS